MQRFAHYKKEFFSVFPYVMDGVAVIELSPDNLTLRTPQPMQ